METVVHFFMFFGAPFSFILGIGMMVQKRKRLINIVHMLSFLGLALWLFQISLYSTGVCDNYSHVYLLKIVFIPFIFMVPPLMVQRYTWIISTRFDFGPRNLLLFSPAFISLIVLALPLVAGIETDPVYLSAKPVFSPEYFSMPVYFRVVYLLFVLPKVYLVLFMISSLVMAAHYRKRTGIKLNRDVVRMGVVFALLITASNMVSVAGDLFSVPLLKFSVLMANASMCSLYLATQRMPDYQRLLMIENRKAHYERTRLKGLDLQSVIARLYEIMEDEKAFADEDLSLRDLAAELSVSPHQLSEILNEKIKKNFNTFVNEYRVREASALLVDEPDRSILSIGAAAGFNSTTTFNTVFSRFTGLSPRQYRKKNLR